MSATTIRSIRAIAWKEWREQRAVLLLGLLLSALLPLFLAAGSAALRGGVDLSDVADVQLVVLACLVAPAFVLATGASTLAGEAGQGTLDFLLTRPVSRATLWLVKIAMGAAVSMSAAGLSTVVAWLISRRAGGDGGFSILSFFDPISSTIGPQTLGMVGLILLVLYASTVFFSTFLARPITAAGAGLTGSIAILTLTFLYWSRLDLDPESVVVFPIVYLTGISLVMLAASRALFCRPGAAATRRGPVAAGLAILAALTLGPVFAIGWLTPLPPESAELMTASLSPSGDAIAVTAWRDSGSPRVLLVRADGSGEEQLTPRLTMNPAFSPDGRWVVYTSRRSWLGLAVNVLSLRAVRPDGREDHLIADGIPLYEDWDSFPMVSPDSTRIALESGDQLVVGSIEGEDVIRVDLEGTSAEGASLWGWTQGSRNVLMMKRGPDGKGCSLLSFDLTVRTWRTLWESQRYYGFTGWYDPTGGYKEVPVLLEKENQEEWDLFLVSASDGSEIAVAEGVCRGSVHMPDPETLAWAVCREDADGALTSRIRMRDLKTGTERDMAEVAGKVGRLSVSPSLERALVSRRLARTSDGLTSSLIGPGGRATDLPSGWVAIEWSGRSRLFVVNYSEDQVAMADATTGMLRRLYP